MYRRRRKLEFGGSRSNTGSWFILKKRFDLIDSFFTGPCNFITTFESGMSCLRIRPHALYNIREKWRRFSKNSTNAALRPNYGLLSMVASEKLSLLFHWKRNNPKSNSWVGSSIWALESKPKYYVMSFLSCWICVATFPNLNSAPLSQHMYLYCFLGAYTCKESQFLISFIYKRFIWVFNGTIYSRDSLCVGL